MIHGPGKLEMSEYPMPDVQADDAVMRVEATALTGADYEYWSGRGSKPEDYPRAIRFPFIPGHIVVGCIDRIGPEAARDWEIQEGDRVLMHYSVTCAKCRMCRAGNDRRCARLMGYGLWFDFASPPHLLGGAADYMYLHPNSKMVKVPDDTDPGRLCLQERFADG
jgi:alcohol dehydrogenase